MSSDESRASEGALEKRASIVAAAAGPPPVPLDVRAGAATGLTRFAGLWLDTAFFVNTGAEANENALKLSLKITGRRKVVAI